MKRFLFPGFLFFTLLMVATSGLSASVQDRLVVLPVLFIPETLDQGLAAQPDSEKLFRICR
ncbi:MAG: hypothetical protein ABSF52_19935 [Syntrophobacteraceae bacterium]|jgi:hypothetical protein